MSDTPNDTVKDNQNDEHKWSKPFTFIQCADPQFGLIYRHILKLGDNEIKWTKEIYLLKLVIKKVNQLSPKPKFMSICGDLVDAFPNKVEMRANQVKDLKLTLAELDPEIRLICVCGNHDVGDIPTRDSIEVYRRDFGADYFSFWQGGCKFIVLNSQLYFNSSLVPELKQEQDEWLDNELGLTSIDTVKPIATHVVVFQHIPLFLKTDDEPADVYFNIEPEQRQNLLKRLKKAGVKKVFCGHYHRNAGGFSGELEVIVTTAIGAQIGSDKHGFRVVHVAKDKIEHELIEVCDNINLLNQTETTN